jgi:hypothetical protein
VVVDNTSSRSSPEKSSSPMPEEGELAKYVHSAMKSKESGATMESPDD